MVDEETQRWLGELTEAMESLTRAVTATAEGAKLEPSDLDGIREELDAVRTAIARANRFTSPDA